MNLTTRFETNPELMCVSCVCVVCVCVGGWMDVAMMKKIVGLND